MNNNEHFVSRNELSLVEQLNDTGKSFKRKMCEICYIIYKNHFNYIKNSIVIARLPKTNAFITLYHY